MVGGARCGRVRWLSWRPWLAGVLAGLVLPVQATPDDDHRRGVLAFQRGDMGGAMTALRAPAQAGHAPSQSLLAHLMAAAPEPVTYAELGARLDPGRPLSEIAVRVHVGRLRNRLRAAGVPEGFIENTRGRGYRLPPP